MSREYIKNDFNFWRYLINFWSVLFFVFIILDFFQRNAYGELLNVLAAIYISALAIYVSNKEFERWYDKHYSRHPGEIFVIIWSVIVLGLFILSFIFREEYQMPTSVISSYIAVLTLLAVTRKSKELYLFRHLKKEKR
jgi:phosphatidylserine synthase